MIPFLGGLDVRLKINIFYSFPGSDILGLFFLLYFLFSYCLELEI